MKFLHLLLFVFALQILPFSDVYAKEGCCSHHGGVASCDYASGHSKCKDGTVSPSCGCTGSQKKTKSTKAVEDNDSYSSKVSNIYNSVKAKAGSIFTSQPKTTSKNNENSHATKGCCSKHGGMGSCDKSKGVYRCKDGTSSSCKCSKEKSKKK